MRALLWLWVVPTAPAAGLQQIAEPKVEGRRVSYFVAAVVLLSDRWAHVAPDRAEAVRRGQEGKQGESLGARHSELSYETNW